MSRSMGCCHLSSHLVGVFITPRDGLCDIEPYRGLIRRASITGGPFANQLLCRGSSVARFGRQSPIDSAEWCSLHEFYIYCYRYVMSAAN